MQVFNYNFNINGNFSQSITQMAQQTDAFTQKEGVSKLPI